MEELMEMLECIEDNRQQSKVWLFLSVQLNTLIMCFLSDRLQDGYNISDLGEDKFSCVWSALFY